MSLAHTDAGRTNRHVVSRENVAEAASTGGKPLPIFTWNLKLRYVSLAKSVSVMCII